MDVLQNPSYFKSLSHATTENLEFQSEVRSDSWRYGLNKDSPG